MKVVITGGCGFIGHHVVNHFLENTNWDIIIIDKLSYASKGYDRLKDIGATENKRVKIFCFDLVSEISTGLKYEIGEDVDYIIHMAAETHVDNSIKDPKLFIVNNVMSTFNLLEYARELKTLKKFFYFSTDEVFGPALGTTLYKEWDRHNPMNPYSASKSAAENICLSYENTYKVPVVILNVMNAFGERQHVEKFIPLCIKKILNNETVYIHAYPDKKRDGSRFYIHAKNIAQAVLFLINNGNPGDKYNISGEREMGNLEMAQFVANVLGKELVYEMINVHDVRPGCDMRYGLDGSKLFNMGWTLKYDLEQSLKTTIEWTLNNKKWLDE